jgi:hypothetical protein
MDDIDAIMASLTLYIDWDTAYSLWADIWVLGDFFDDRILLTDHINQLIVVPSLIEPLLLYGHHILLPT